MLNNLPLTFSELGSWGEQAQERLPGRLGCSTSVWAVLRVYTNKSVGFPDLLFPFGQVSEQHPI